MFQFPIPVTPPVPASDLPPFVAARDVFTAQELDRITETALRISEREVRVGTVLQVNKELNRSVFRHIPPDRDTVWIYSRLAETLSVINAQVFRFDITGFDEMLDFITYRASDRGHYDWHIDGQPPNKPLRKLAISVQMTDPDAYDGGDLSINKSGDPVVAPRGRGAVIVFPCYHLHRVSAVTRGVRSALVSWVVGPPFK